MKIEVKPIKKNMFEVRINGIRLLQSYATIVAMNRDDRYYVTDVEYSATTNSHIQQWLGETVRPIEKMPQKFFDDIEV